MVVTPTVLRNVRALSSWLSVEIGDPYYCDSASYRNQPSGVHQFSFRKSCCLVPEQRKALTLFIRHLIVLYLDTGKTRVESVRDVCNNIITTVNTQNDNIHPCEIMRVNGEAELVNCCSAFNEEFVNLAEYLTEEALDDMYYFAHNVAYYTGLAKRKFSIHVECPIKAVEKGVTLYSDKEIYVVREEWDTNNSSDNTAGWNFFTFNRFREAMLFILRLIAKLNNYSQNRLWQEAEYFATAVTKKYFAKQYSRQVRMEKATKAPAHKTSELREARVSCTTHLPLVKSKGMKSVYIFDMGNTTIKIGISQSIEQRRTSIMNSSGLMIAKYCFTEKMPATNALKLESDLHSLFSSRRTRGEFFKVPYDEAVFVLGSNVPGLTFRNVDCDWAKPN